MNELNIDIICANSAAAKRRVERANSTLQGRLVKELRLRGISSVDGANAFALEFVADYNTRCAKAAHNPFNAHRALLSTEVLDEIARADPDDRRLRRRPSAVATGASVRPDAFAVVRASMLGPLLGVVSGI